MDRMRHLKILEIPLQERGQNGLCNSPMLLLMSIQRFGNHQNICITAEKFRWELPLVWLSSHLRTATQIFPLGKIPKMMCGC